MFIDSHCHLNSFSKIDCGQILEQCGRNHILIDSSICYDSSVISCDLSKNNSFVYTALGFHPVSAGKYNSETIDRYRQLLVQEKKIILIGEIGLDSKSIVPMERQSDILRAFIRLANEFSLPIAIHNRMEKDPYRIIKILEEYKFDFTKLICHCFSFGRKEMAVFLDRGAIISFSLNILRKNENILTGLRFCPREKIILETDSPYMRIDGKQSFPFDICLSYEYVAEYRNVSLESLKEQINSNIRTVLKLA